MSDDQDYRERPGIFRYFKYFTGGDYEYSRKPKVS